MNLKLNVLYWHLILHFMPRSSKYVGMVPCICKEQLSGLVNSIPVFHFSVSFESASKIQGWLTSYLKLELWYKGSLPGVMKDWHFNRSVRVMKIMTEALWKKLLFSFIDTQSKEEKGKFITLSKSLYYAFPQTQFQHLCTSSDFKKFERKLSLLIQERCSQFLTFAFWMSYLNMADLF